MERATVKTTLSRVSSLSILLLLLLLLDMLRLWKWYQNCLAVHPVKTQVISSGLIWGAGDIAAQAVTHYTAKKRVTFDAVFYCVVSFKDFVFGQMGVCVCVFCLVWGVAFGSND